MNGSFRAAAPWQHTAVQLVEADQQHTASLGLGAEGVAEADGAEARQPAPRRVRAPVGEEFPGPPAYRALVQRRVNAIERSTSLWLLEQPEYKRRWSDESWEARVDVVLRQRLLDRCEEPHLWFEPSPVGPKPVARTPRQLAELLGEDEDFTTLAALYAPGSGTTNTLLDLLLDLLGDEHVPQAAPLRYKASGIAKRHEWERAWKAQRREDREGFTDNGSPSMPDPPRFTSVDFLRPSYWRHRGKFDIPNERFISFASSASLLSPTTPIGWAGCSADERASAVPGLLEGDSHAPGVAHGAR